MAADASPRARTASRLSFNAAPAASTATSCRRFSGSWLRTSRFNRRTMTRANFPWSSSTFDAPDTSQPKRPLNGAQ